jgi:hypothetical protein
VIDILKAAYREIGQEFNVFPSRPITIILYNEKGFFDVTRAPGWAGGLFDGKIRLPIKGIEGQGTLLHRILFHEYTHALIHQMTPSCPLWLNEGLAEFFSGRQARKCGQIIPLRLLERNFPSQPQGIALAYMESYSAVSFLIEKFGLYRIKELLERMGEGKNITEAFSDVLYEDYDRFLNTWGKN